MIGHGIRITTLGALALSLILQAPLAAKDRKITLRNRISVDINQVRPRVRGTKDWGVNLLGPERLRAGRSVDIILGSDGDDCLFDFKVYDDEGDVWYMHRVDICKSPLIDMK